MTSRLVQLACMAAAVLLTATLAACGGSSKKSTTKTAPAAASSSTSRTDERSQAKAALAQWIALTPKVNAAFAQYGKEEPAHAQAHNPLAVRRDAYNLRNAVYRFDLGIRKIQFPASIQPDVNAVLDTTKSMVAALDGVSQSSKTADIDRNIRKANAVTRGFDAPVNKVNDELHLLAGEPRASATSTGSSPQVTRVAAGLLKAASKSGAKGQADATCAAKLLVKKLTKADLDKLAAGQIPQSGPLSNEVGASLLACQAAK